jgi:EAL domain-containing protein (putative c-di-GMP-specific phosphodiesterase class I)
VSSKRRLRVLIAEDSAEVREALAALIRREPAFELVGAVANAIEAIELAAAEQPDVVLLDVRMPGGGGKAAAAGIKRSSPGSKLIALSEHDDRATVREMLKAGVIGYLVKGGSNREIVEAVKSAALGKGSLSSNVTNHLIQAFSQQLRHRARSSRQQRGCAARIRRVLRGESGFAMVFQPIVELRSRRVVGAEALARFDGRPSRPPDTWFAEAAGVGLGLELELAAVRKALATLQQLPDGIYLSVNVAPATLATSQFYDLVAEADGSRLVAEITEHALVQDYERVAAPLAKLRALGMRIAVDDAGAGFASFRHILNLSPELIKLDLTLIREIDRDQSRQALAAALIAFAQKSGATIIAEGIEQAPELKTLVELGVTYGQGYLLGRPASLPVGSLPATPPAESSAGRGSRPPKIARTAP